MIHSYDWKSVAKVLWHKRAFLHLFCFYLLDLHWNVDVKFPMQSNCILKMHITFIGVYKNGFGSMATRAEFLRRTILPLSFWFSHIEKFGLSKILILKNLGKCKEYLQIIYQQSRRTKKRISLTTFDFEWVKFFTMAEFKFTSGSWHSLDEKHWDIIY